MNTSAHSPYSPYSPYSPLRQRCLAITLGCLLAAGCASRDSNTSSPTTAQATGDWHCAGALDSPTWDCERKGEAPESR